MLENSSRHGWIKLTTFLDSVGLADPTISAAFSSVGGCGLAGAEAPTPLPSVGVRRLLFPSRIRSVNIMRVVRAIVDRDSHSGSRITMILDAKSQVMPTVTHPVKN